jgi:hypothetical protein
MLGRFNSGFGLLRPRALARTNKSVDDLTSEVRDLKRTTKSMAADLARRDEMVQALMSRLEVVTNEVKLAGESVRALLARESQLRAVLRADATLEDAMASLPAILDQERIAGHMTAAVARTQLRREPFPHAVVEDVFPADFYAALLRGIPPGELFGDKTRNKEHVNVPLTVAPAYSRRVWNFLVYELQPQLQPMLVGLFREPMGEWIASEWPALAADPFAPPMQLNTADGRIMRRGRGYYISPHRDPKWGFITGILYLARPQDSQRWGTQLFAVDEDGDAVGAAPHWIDPERCRLVVDVPYRPNTMLVMLNSGGAHGANIPEDAEPADLQRYIYQFRIGPGGPAISRLTALLPEHRRALWAGKVPVM